ncbi:MAG: helix-turn-helix transcriptional regulator [Flexilinea sp.]
MNIDLKEQRNQKKLTQSELAQKIGTTRPTITRYETGVRRPSVTVAKKIADVLGFDWTLFFEDQKK